MDEQAASFWMRVNAMIKAQGKKQETVSYNCGIPYQTFRGWISRDRFPDAAQSSAIAKELKTSVEYLVTGEEPQNHAEEKLTKVKDLLSETLRIANQ